MQAGSVSFGSALRSGECVCQLPPNLRSRRTSNVTRQYKERECRISLSPYTPPLLSLSLSLPLLSPALIARFYLFWILDYFFFHSAFVCARSLSSSPELLLANGWRRIPKSDCPLLFGLLLLFFSSGGICFSVCLSPRRLCAKFSLLLLRRRFGEKHFNDRCLITGNWEKN